jgi:hypothetical protein
MANMMTKALELVNNWGISTASRSTQPKRSSLCSKAERKYKNEPPSTWQAKSLKYSNNMKYLGITLNKRLSFTNHLNEKMRKVGYLQNKINQIIGQEWGLTPARAHWVHTAIIRPKITYASIVWANVLNQDSN